jgi:small subunit ribosomal protein S4
LCRRQGVKLFLKGDRCYSAKCAMERRNLPPGQHGTRRSKPTDYGVRLAEKQKLKRIYSVMETQFRRYFANASRKKGITGEELIRILETRLDNVVHRMGFCASRNQGRQYVRHGHFSVNGKPVNIPSYVVKAGDVVTVREKSREVPQIKESMEQSKKRGLVRWVDTDWDQFSSTFKYIPSREEVSLPVQEQLIVELYSR